MTVARFFPSFLASFFFFLLILVLASFLLSGHRFWGFYCASGDCALCPDDMTVWRHGSKLSCRRDTQGNGFAACSSTLNGAKTLFYETFCISFFPQSRLKGRARAASHLPDLRKPGKTGENRGKPGRFSERHAPSLRDQTGHLGAKNGT